MGDSFAQSIQVHAAPKGHRRAYRQLADKLNELSWARDWDSFRSDLWTALEVAEAIGSENTTFTVDEGRFDELEQIGNILSEHGFIWTGQIDPKYEYLGDYFAFVPELGLFTAECDADGNVVISSHTLRQLIDEAESLDELRETVDKRTGKAWDDAIARATVKYWAYPGEKRQPAECWAWQSGDRWMAVLHGEHDTWWDGAAPEDIEARPDDWWRLITAVPDRGTLLYRNADGEEVTETP